MAAYLKKPYALEGWRDKPYCLRDTRSCAIRPLTRPEFEVVRGLDAPPAAGPGAPREDGPRADGPRAPAADSMAFARLALQGFITHDPAQAASPRYLYHDYLRRDVVQLSVTDRCNFRCRHCMATEGGFAGRGELSLAQMEDLFAQMARLGIRYVEFTGGEPLLRDDFAQIVQAADGAGLRIRRIYTNGFLLRAGLLGQLRALGQAPVFVISFDGLGVHDWMRRASGAESCALAAMDLVRREGFELVASVNVNAASAPVLEQTCRHLVFEREVDALHLMRTAPSPAWNAALSQTGVQADLDCDAYFEAMLSLLEVSREEAWPADLDILHMPTLHLHAPCGVFERIADLPPATGREKTMACCPKASSMLFIASDGRALFCSAFEGASLAWGVMGGDDVNIRTASLRDILSDSAYSRRYEETVADMLEKEERCRGCRWLALCRGGCPLSRLADAHQDSLAQSCRLFRGGYFERYLEAIGAYPGDRRPLDG